MPSNETALEKTKSRAASPFKFPASLSARHEEELRKRAISREFALASGVRSACDNELRDLNFQASLPREERTKGLQGICFPYVDLELNAEAAWRIKPDATFTMSDGSHPKYLSRIGDKPRAYYPHTTTLELLSDPRVNVVITEGEYKTLAIAEALQTAERKRKFSVIGLQGVNGGWHRDKKIVPTADGGHEKKPTGPPHLIDDLQSVEWKKRTVYTSVLIPTSPAKSMLHLSSSPSMPAPGVPSSSWPNCSGPRERKSGSWRSRTTTAEKRSEPTITSQSTVSMLS